ncbi:FKBP-type peptidyl-prolyl cis-trans isomerase [Actinotalea sp.]|uniref:FKBP-type peptidyl-prolyl cis-trans isomerase n=1 Tax=Actinotalea sp. TaxID=1872145 RepID=UPI0035680209
MRGVLTAVVALVLVLGLSTGCSVEPRLDPNVTVTGAFGVEPTLTFTSPLDVSDRRIEVLAEGTGDEVVEGKAVLVHYWSESGEDGSVIGETYSDAPRAYLLTVDAVGQDIFDTLSGRKVGARVLQVLPAEGDAPPTVTVFDILPTRAQGAAVEPRDGLPTVTLAADGTPTITSTDAEPPLEVTAQPLIRGEGPQIEPGEIITVQYTGATWDDGTVFDSTWGQDMLPAAFPIGVGSVPAGWDEGLVEQTVGSQVLLVLPPGSGYGGNDDELADTTLVFVVDILAATGGPEGS